MVHMARRPDTYPAGVEPHKLYHELRYKFHLLDSSSIMMMHLMVHRSTQDQEKQSHLKQGCSSLLNEKRAQRIKVLHLVDDAA
jgi:hypothetical protein